MKSIFVLSTDKIILESFRTSLGSKFKVYGSAEIPPALEKIRKTRSDFIFIDLDLLRSSLNGQDYKAILQGFWEIYPTLEIIIMSAPEMLREAVKVVKAGANTYLNYPIDPDELRLIIASITEYKIMESELDYLREQFWQSDSLQIIKTQSSKMHQVFQKIRAVAPTKSTVLLSGETGTGKGLLANIIHHHSRRSNQPFIAVHCGAIPDTLLESELFGHEKGAFTGADRRRLGKFEIAKGGTIFLDEIGTITPTAQIKLLQILQDQTFQRVGGDEILEADVRIISATNSDILKMCEEGQFRYDLFYRLNVFPIEIPLLRERKEDIPHLVDVILNRMNKLHLKDILGIQPKVMAAFQEYSWPGNIRELENVLERAYILENTSILSYENFPPEIIHSKSSGARINIDSGITLAEARNHGIMEIERFYLQSLLEKFQGKIGTSARNAGITPRQLFNLLKKYGIRKEEFKSSKSPGR